MTEHSNVEYVEFHSDEEKQKKTVIIDDIYLTKWKEMTIGELDEEYTTLLNKLPLATAKNIYNQLTAVINLLDNYRTQRKKKDEQQ